MAAVVMTGLLALPYAYAYVGAKGTVGTRSIEQFRLYSASLTNYLSAPQINRFYGSTAITDPMLADEMNLFPGVVTVLLALTGVFGSRSRSRYPYVIGLIFAIVMTAGANGVLYGWLFEHVQLFRALRSPARFEILVLLCLAVLSAYGMAALARQDRICQAEGRGHGCRRNALDDRICLWASDRSRACALEDGRLSCAKTAGRHRRAAVDI